MAVVVRNIVRAERELVDAFGAIGTATVHEAMGRTGNLDPALRPVYCARIAGSAVTVSVPPADNWMIHVAIEQCREGDILVIAPTAPSDAGYVGDLIATALQARGVRGVVVDGGCRDTADLTEMGFPVWSRYVSVYGTVKRTLGDVNLPVVCGGQLIHPGDIIVADDDGVVVVPRASAATVLEASRVRERSEAASRARYAAGELSLDVKSMRAELAEAGLIYLDEPPGGVQ